MVFSYLMRFKQLLYKELFLEKDRKIIDNKSESLRESECLTWKHLAISS